MKNYKHVEQKEHEPHLMLSSEACWRVFIISEIYIFFPSAEI